MADSRSLRNYFSIVGRVGRFPELDGLRGIAILLVLLRHAAHPIVEQHGSLFLLGDWDVATPLLNGWMGVDLFFVLSGFLITFHLQKHWPPRIDRQFIMRYWAKRLLRTFPAYLAAVLIALFSLVPLFKVQVDNTVYSLTIHLLFLQDYLGSDLVVAFWSLGVEEKFYILCPFALIYLRRLQPRRQLIFLAALALLPSLLRFVTVSENSELLLNYSAFFWTVRSPFHLAMDGLWMGVICALIVTNPSLRSLALRFNLRRIWNVCLVLLIVLMFPVAWFDEGWQYSSAIVIALVSLAFAGLLLTSVLQPSAGTSALRPTWLRALSTISYSVYLLHLMFVPLCMELTTRILPSTTTSPLLHFMVFAMLFLPISVVGGLALHYIVEKPFLIAKERIRL